MIQRIQSVYLLLLTISSTLGLFLLPSIEIKEFSFFTKTLFETYLIVSTVLSVLALFTFKHRKTQLLINRLQLILQSFISLVLIYGLTQLTKRNDYLIWLLMPVQAIFFIILANGAIREDEALIKSIDRLR
jgi:fumarate reductase subunit D